MRSRLPVLRDRRRYIAMEIEAEDAVSPRDLAAEIHSTYQSLYGDTGGARLKLVVFDGRFGLLRCRNCHITEARTALATVHSIGGTRAAIRVLGVSGTIKAATEKYIPQLGLIAPEEHRRRIELKEISGTIARSRGREIDLSPDNPGEGSDTKYVGLTSFDVNGGCDDADGTSDGL